MDNEEQNLAQDIEAVAEHGDGQLVVHDEPPKQTQNIFRRHITDDPNKKLLARHRMWLDSLQHEYPLPYVSYKIGVYIRYHNQTKHPDYLQKHIDQFTDDIALCPNWTLVGFYIDKCKHHL